ncbi:MAG: DUF4293 domain-containing protein [Hymenobacteraceae bacterium]|nr:DUF4293 domain-containing protein [Hymenobacteraceae bacterium]MDX5396516.1 DUF4293 domain-containing protein [Hymenobacteraceae bacterium]MDX5443111.1 DUF4293 domain-containing protein [Hymenobacteraceae bacterium]MDX5512583.1 DUF4293 domain-containing protein [Hymenobacteraceae bacterium]
MIQRIQSVFLLLLAICMLVLLIAPIWQKINPETNQVFELTAFSLHATGGETEAGQDFNKNTMFIAVLAIVAAGVALFEIFQFKNRLKQMKLGLLNTLVLAGLMGLCLYYSTYVGEDLVASTEPGSYRYGFFLPAAALFLNVLANRFIKRDEDLVRSVDRLR